MLCHPVLADLGEILLLTLKNQTTMLRETHKDQRAAQKGESEPRMAGGKKVGASVIQPQGDKFCQPPESTWKQILPQNLGMRTQPG